MRDSTSFPWTVKGRIEESSSAWRATHGILVRLREPTAPTRIASARGISGTSGVNAKRLMPMAAASETTPTTTIDRVPTDGDFRLEADRSCDDDIGPAAMGWGTRAMKQEKQDCRTAEIRLLCSRSRLPSIAVGAARFRRSRDNLPRGSRPWTPPLSKACAWKTGRRS